MAKVSDCKHVDVTPELQEKMDAIFEFFDEAAQTVRLEESYIKSYRATWL